MLTLAHVVFGAVLGLMAGVAPAQTALVYPAKPIRLLLPYTSGGPADLIARAVSDKISLALAQSIVFEHRPGAGGNVAMEVVAKSSPDGHTLLFGGPAVAINGALYGKLAFDPLKDLVPISLAAIGPYAVYGTATLPIETVADFIAYAKAKPGQLNYASVGIGSGTHLAAVLFGLAAGIQMTHIPYKGLQQIAPDLVAGQVHLTFSGIGPLAGFVQSGKVRLLAMSGPKRLANFTNVPTLAETVAGFDVGGWYGFFAPANTPRAILQRLNDDIVTALKQPDLSDRIERMALFAAPQSLEEAVRFVQSEADKSARAVRASGASAE